MAELEKAFLEIEGGGRVPCMFNPNSFSLSLSNDWTAPESTPGMGVKTLTFAGAKSGTMSLDLFFDTTATGKPVTDHTSKIVKVMEIDPNLPGSDPESGNARPPTVTFHWGNLHAFPAVVDELSLEFTYFSSAGVPLRANMSLSMTQYEDANAFGPQNPTSGTPKPHRVHRVMPGETLDRISARYYGDSTRWRLIAAANGLEDPLALQPGQVVSIPRGDG